MQPRTSSIVHLNFSFDPLSSVKYSEKSENVVGLDPCIGLFQKKITFLVRKVQKFCVLFLTLYAFIICQVIIRPQYYINASLISAPVLILYQIVRGT